MGGSHVTRADDAVMSLAWRFCGDSGIAGASESKVYIHVKMLFYDERILCNIYNDLVPILLYPILTILRYFEGITGYVSKRC